MGKVLKIVGGVVVVLVVLGAIAGGGGDSETPVKGAVESSAGEAPAADANVVGNWEILNEPKFRREMGMFTTVDLRVRNVSDSEDEPWLEIRLTKGDNLVTTFDCVGDTVRAGERTTLECFSGDDYRKFTDYEILNAF